MVANMSIDESKITRRSRSSFCAHLFSFSFWLQPPRAYAHERIRRRTSCAHISLTICNQLRAGRSKCRAQRVGRGKRKGRWAGLLCGKGTRLQPKQKGDDPEREHDEVSQAGGWKRMEKTRRAAMPKRDRKKKRKRERGKKTKAGRAKSCTVTTHTDDTAARCARA